MTKRKTARPVYTCQCQSHAWTALTRGYVTLVSPEDAHFIQKQRWHAKVVNRTVYAYAKKSNSLHSLILNSPIVDHKDNNGLDNRRSNLRPSTRQQNQANRRKYRTGFKGTEQQPNLKWRSKITVFSKVLCLGTYFTAEEAARAYDAAAIKHFGEFARLNFPTDGRVRSSSPAFHHRAASPSELSWQQPQQLAFAWPATSELNYPDPEDSRA